MTQTDPIADLLTRIRNGYRARHETVSVPVSRLKVRLAEVLKKEGYVDQVEVADEATRKNIRITLRYLRGRQPALMEIKRVSRPGCRIYASVDELQNLKSGITTTILSTSKGIMTDREAREQKIGGEVIFQVQ